MKDSEILLELICLAFESTACKKSGAPLRECIRLYERVKASESRIVTETPAEGMARIKEEKKEILDRLVKYREENGLGCFDEIEQVTGGRITADICRNIITKGAKIGIAEWRCIREALDQLEAVK